MADIKQSDQYASMADLIYRQDKELIELRGALREYADAMEETAIQVRELLKDDT